MSAGSFTPGDVALQEHIHLLIIHVVCSVFFGYLGNDKHNIHRQLCDSLQCTQVGAVLAQVTEKESRGMYLKYLSDFVKMVHKSPHPTLETNMEEYEVKPSL